MQIDLRHGDSRKVLAQLIRDNVKVHSVVTDPPYYLESVVKRFGKAGAKGARHGSDGRFARQSSGFIGKTWDGADDDGMRIAQDSSFWKLVFDILLPGGYAVAFSSARTGHWQAVAMELAGFVIHPFIGWVYGSGLPKGKCAVRALGDRPEADNWRGWYYGTQARKPAIEPIYIGQKPFSEKNAALNILKHGVGPVNIDACRAPGNRWPANLVFDGSESAKSLIPADAAEFFESYRYLCDECLDLGWVGGGTPGIDAWQEACPNCAGRSAIVSPFDEIPIAYHAKASKEDRAGSRHPTVKPVPFIQSLIRHVTPAGGIVLDPFAGSGTTAEAARREGVDCILIEQDHQYVADIERRFGLCSPAYDYLMKICDPQTYPHLTERR